MPNTISTAGYLIEPDSQTLDYNSVETFSVVSGAKHFRVKSKIEMVNEMIEELNFDSIKQHIFQNISDIIKINKIEVSKTGENELLIYKQLGRNTWLNVIIDEDGDIEIMRIPKNRRKIKSKRFYNNNYSEKDIITAFNELHG